jgi:hypothetical protein
LVYEQTVLEEFTPYHRIFTPGMWEVAWYPFTRPWVTFRREMMQYRSLLLSLRRDGVTGVFPSNQDFHALNLAREMSGNIFQTADGSLIAR